MVLSVESPEQSMLPHLKKMPEGVLTKKAPGRDVRRPDGLDTITDYKYLLLQFCKKPYQVFFSTCLFFFT
jgi:hypothetical protein